MRPGAVAARLAAGRSEDRPVPAKVQRVLSTPGRPLAAEEAAGVVRPSFDFRRIRIHSDRDAAASAEQLGARAYTFGPHIAFARDQYAPLSDEGRRLLAHEVAHVVHQVDAVGPPRRVAGRDSAAEHHADGPGATNDAVLCDEDPASRARYPSADERREIRDVLSPTETAAEEAGTDPDPLTDPDGFKAAMTATMVAFIDSVLPAFEARRDASVRLGGTDLDALAVVVEEAVTADYGDDIRAGGTDLDAVDLRSHLHFPDPAPGAEFIEQWSHDWIANRMHAVARELFTAHHVLESRDADAILIEETITAIRGERAAELAVMAANPEGFEEAGEAFIPPGVAASSGESEDETRRRGRWKVLGTAIHEMFHAVRHPDFDTAVRPLEESGVGIEGFAEYFTQQVYPALVTRAGEDAGLRLQIEGLDGPPMTPPERTPALYARYVEGVETILAAVGGNQDNLRAAYFMGRVELIGLGGWNEADARAHYLARFPRYELGGAIVLEWPDGRSRAARARFGWIVAGRTGPFQLELGPAISYLSAGDHLGLGGDASVRYQWPNLYLGAGVLAEASLSASPGDEERSSTIRLDLVPRVEAGVKFARFRAGVSLDVLCPIVGGDASDRTVRVLLGLGASVTFR